MQGTGQGQGQHPRSDIIPPSQLGTDHGAPAGSASAQRSARMRYPTDLRPSMRMSQQMTVSARQRASGIDTAGATRHRRTRRNQRKQRFSEALKMFRLRHPAGQLSWHPTHIRHSARSWDWSTWRRTTVPMWMQVKNRGHSGVKIRAEDQCQRRCWQKWRH